MTRLLPSAAGNVAQSYPEIWKAYADLGKSVSSAGPLTPKMRRLVKLGLAIGVGSEGAVHSHVRRALEEGLSKDEIKHATLLAITTIGFPKAIAALSWVEDITDAS